MIFPVVHPEATDVFFLFEQDREAAKAMRDRFFPMAAAEGALIAATHMPFPRLGRVVADRGLMRWQAADWALQKGWARGESLPKHWMSRYYHDEPEVIVRSVRNQEKIWAP